MDTNETATATSAAVTPRQRKLPRGFIRVKARLERAIKGGATMAGLLGSHASVGTRIKAGEAVRRSSLRTVDNALTAWEEKEPVRLRAAKRVMRKPDRRSTARTAMRKAAGSSKEEVLYVGEAEAILTVLEAVGMTPFKTLSPQAKARLITLLS